VLVMQSKTPMTSAQKVFCTAKLEYPPIKLNNAAIRGGSHFFVKKLEMNKAITPVNTPNNSNSCIFVSVNVGAVFAFGRQAPT